MQGTRGFTSPGRHDFPEIYPLCRVKTVDRGYVSFCEWEVVSGGMCSWHLSLLEHKEKAVGLAWEGQYEIKFLHEEVI